MFAYGSRSFLQHNGLKVHGLSLRNCLSALFAHAKSRIWICTYVFSCNENRKSDPVTGWLKLFTGYVESKSVDVRIVLDLPKKNRPNYSCNSYFMRYFFAHGIPFRSLPSQNSIHGKLIIIDDEIVFVGSHNMAASSLFNPSDLTVEIRNTGTCQKMIDYYMSMWKICAVPAFFSRLDQECYGESSKFDIR